MQRLNIQVYNCMWTFVALIIIRPEIVISVSESLFASLSQMELLWQNDINVVKTMEHLLEERLPEYEPLKRFSMN